MYDDDGNVTSVHHPEGNETNFGFDAIDRRVASTDGTGALTTFGCDDASNLA